MNSMSHEAIRLVIWDLDDTFWRGVLSEGGVREYVREHHDIVVELARRGIVSSICSKNDRVAVEAVLREQGLWDYFVFPSVNWDPKGPRIADLVEKIGLRAPTVLFIDDNPGHRAEAAAAVPDLQIADETYIAGMQANPLLKGKDDAGLTRLKQYKLLEAKRRDEREAGGANDEFLRSSDIRVEFEYDVAVHLDRAIELINRTNQLNYTKRRLPEDLAAARIALLEELQSFAHQAALVRVTDRYGDYGHCGFYLRRMGQGGGVGQLFYYCFSCRTLGMFVEQWVFEHLGRPKLDVVGPVLTDLSQQRDIDWIRLWQVAGSSGELRRPFPEVRLRGGCEIDALSHYFAGPAARCSRESSVTRGPFFALKDCSHHIVGPSAAPLDDEFLALAEACGYRREDFETELVTPCPPGTLVIFCTWGDIREAYRHKRTGRLLTVRIETADGVVYDLSDPAFERHLARPSLSAAHRELIERAAATMRRTAEFVGRPSQREVKENLRRLLAAAPAGSRVVAIAADEVRKGTGGKGKVRLAQTYNRCLQEVAAPLGVKVFAIGDYVHSDNERLETPHFDRIVYFRLASAIIDWAAKGIEAAQTAMERPRRVAPGTLNRLRPKFFAARGLL
jgi:FkbH-like protein